MSVTLHVNIEKRSKGEFIKYAAGLLSEQVWRWGFDILRTGANWIYIAAFVIRLIDVERYGSRYFRE